MELTWINKLRIAAVAGLGIVILGLLAWPVAAPADPLQPIRASNINFSGTLLLLFLAFGIGFAGYFISWPHGREIGILGVPFGLAVWAGRSGHMRVLTQACDEAVQRAALVRALRVEPLYWMLIVAAGFAGVLAAQYIHPTPKPRTTEGPTQPRHGANIYLNGLIALAAAVVIAQFFIGVFAQNLQMSRSVAAQPATGQILFGVAAAFAVAAFVVKRLLDLSYLLPAAASLFVVAFAQVVYYNGATIQRFAETYPAPFFPHSIFAVVPVQLVSLAALGSVIGYWLAVRYDYWRKHETA